MRSKLTQDKIEDFRARLCDTALKAWVSEGREGISMRRLAKSLGCSPTTPYRYFDDKDAILVAIQARAHATLADALENALATEGDTLKRSQAVAKAYMQFALENPEAYGLMFDGSIGKQTDRSDLTVQATRAKQALMNHTELLQKDQLKDENTDLFGDVIWSAIHGVAMLQINGQFKDEAHYWEVYSALTDAIFARWAA